jgi:hypothetical protein
VKTFSRCEREDRSLQARGAVSAMISIGVTVTSLTQRRDAAVAFLNHATSH